MSVVCARAQHARRRPHVGEEAQEGCDELLVRAVHTVVYATRPHARTTEALELIRRLISFLRLPPPLPEGSFVTPLPESRAGRQEDISLESSTYGRASRGEGEINLQKRDPEKEIARPVIGDPA